MTIYSRITGTGSYLPEKVLRNRDLEGTIDTSDEWIYTRTGIRQRHIAADAETTSDLALVASRRAIEAAGIAPEDIDLIIVATTTPDMIFPSTACLLQAKLGVKRGAAFDVQAVLAHCRASLADFKVPQYIATREDPLPRNPGGKLLKKQLREETQWGKPLR